MLSRTLLFAILLLGCRRVPGEWISNHGILARFHDGPAVDALVLPNAALFLAPSQAPTTLLDRVAEVELSGGISVELRAGYQFQFHSSVPAELTINSQSILSSSDPGLSPLSKSTRLSRGTNAVHVTLHPTPGAPIQLQLFWKPRNLAVPIPIPSAALTFDAADATLQKSASLRQGLSAVARYRCVQCHAADARGFSDLAFDTPDLSHLGARLREPWLAEWIADPASLRPDAHMPRTVSTSEAAQIAAYLASLGSPVQFPAAGSPDRGKKLFANLKCDRCHTFGGPAEPEKISLDRVAAKFQPAALAAFLLNPSASYRWIRMPDFHLSPDEAADLVSFLTDGRNPASPQTAGDLERGRELFESSGCRACHAGPGPNRVRVMPPPLTTLTNLDAGCLASDPSSAPRFSFAGGDRDALKEFLRGGRWDALRRDTPLEFALRHGASLRCVECHNVPDGIVKTEVIGGKLRPDWIARFLDGQIEYKPRPWLSARMPAFHAWSERLASGLAALNGQEPSAPSEPPVISEMVPVGARLVSAEGGFSCGACHAVGTRNASGVVESPGVNLARAPERLLKSYFHRWVLNPLAVDPATKMPVYFDETAKSQLIDFYDGDAERQIEAIWQYLRTLSLRGQ